MARDHCRKISEKCIRSWKENLPDYKIVIWNEDKFDINSNPYTKRAYEEKKFAFVSDYVRLYALYNFGGIYLDTDVEVKRNLDEFLKHDAFIGYEKPGILGTGIIGSSKKNKWIGEVLDYYEKIVSKNTFEFQANPYIFSKVSLGYGLRSEDINHKLECGVYVYSSDYFSPIDWSSRALNITKNTHTIHYYNASWFPRKRRLMIKMKTILRVLIGNRVYSRVIVI